MTQDQILHEALGDNLSGPEPEIEPEDKVRTDSGIKYDI